MLKKHNKHGPLKWFTAAAFLTAGLLVAAPVAKPVYAEDSSPAVQTSYVGFSAVSAVVENNVSVKQYGYYHIAFDGNGGNGSIDPMTLVTDETENLPKNVFTRAGYTFTGWKGSDGKTYTDGQSVTNLTDKNDATITMTAQWSANTYTATFNLNYDSKTASVPKFASGSSFSMKKHTDEAFGTLPELDRRLGYTFDGWYTQPTGGTKLTESSKMPASDMTYYAHWTVTNYRIYYGMDHGRQDASWPTSYTIEDTYTIGVPYGKDSSNTMGIERSTSNGQTVTYYFTGWTGPGVSGYPDTITIKKGTTGNKMYGSTWSANGYRVRCEDWTVDYNGNLYQKLSSDNSHNFVFAKPGETVSGTHWGTDTTGERYYGFKQYHGSSSVTVSNHNTVVYRYFWANDRTVESNSYDGSRAIPLTYDLTSTYHDIHGNVIHTETQTGMTDVFYRPYVPDGVWYTVSNVKSKGYTIYEIREANYNPMIIWSNGVNADQFRLHFYQTVVKWDNASQSFVGAQYAQDTFASTVPMLKSKIVSIGGKDYDVIKTTSVFFPRNSVIRLKSWQLDRGWIYKPTDLTRYYGGGEGSYRNILIYNQDAKLDAPMHVDSGQVVQDAYAVVFDANGGVGEMNDQLIENTTTDGSTPNRKLGTHTFTNPYATFLGWSTKPDATEPETYKGVKLVDGATMPANAVEAGTYLKLYAVWKWNDAPSGAKANSMPQEKAERKDTTFIWGD